MEIQFSRHPFVIALCGDSGYNGLSYFKVSITFVLSIVLSLVFGSPIPMLLNLFSFGAIVVNLPPIEHSFFFGVAAYKNESDLIADEIAVSFYRWHKMIYMPWRYIVYSRYQIDWSGNKKECGHRGWFTNDCLLATDYTSLYTPDGAKFTIRVNGYVTAIERRPIWFKWTSLLSRTEYVANLFFFDPNLPVIRTEGGTQFNIHLNSDDYRFELQDIIFDIQSRFELVYRKGEIRIKRIFDNKI